jgi:hypothetical protein
MKITYFSWRGAGAADRGGLENRCGGNSTQGSNPCPSAIHKDDRYIPFGMILVLKAQAGSVWFVPRF